MYLNSPLVPPPNDRPSIVTTLAPSLPSSSLFVRSSPYQRRSRWSRSRRSAERMVEYHRSRYRSWRRWNRRSGSGESWESGTEGRRKGEREGWLAFQPNLSLAAFPPSLAKNDALMDSFTFLCYRLISLDTLVSRFSAPLPHPRLSFPLRRCADRVRDLSPPLRPLPRLQLQTSTPLLVQLTTGSTRRLLRLTRTVPSRAGLEERDLEEGSSRPSLLSFALSLRLLAKLTLSTFPPAAPSRSGAINGLFW